MISKSTIKLVKALTLKKQRQKEGLFLVEGDKNTVEALKSHYTVSKLFATPSFLSANGTIVKNARRVFEVEGQEIKKASLLKTPQNSLALCEIPLSEEFQGEWDFNFSLFLDRIQDPGNLGTIIRICDWFGIETLFCSMETADCYNPKVIQASMGSFCRVNIFYAPFEQIATAAVSANATIFGAFLEGKNVFTENLPSKALLVVGNEGRGISREIEKNIQKKIVIPGFSKSDTGAESLNVAVATGILCSEFKRQHTF